MSVVRPLSVLHIMQMPTMILLFFPLSNLEVNAHFLIFTVVLTATSPAFFRGFTLIALKDGKEGTAYKDYAGQFQVSAQNSYGIYMK